METPNEKNTNGTTTKERLKGINTGKIISEAQHLISTAVGVLEKEVAAGIVAAKKLEKKLIDVEEVRNNDPTELMSRIRQDAYAVVDLVLDAVTLVVNRLDNISENLDKAQKNTSPPKPSAQIPVVKTEEPAGPGTTIDVPFVLRNDSAEQSMKVELNKVDLINPKGSKILARNLRVVPDVVELKPGEEREVKIQVRIPKSTGKGIYSGLIQDKEHADLCAVLIISVEQP